MSKTTHDAYGTFTTCLTTELNSLANGAVSAASGAIDNSSNLEMFADLELVLAAQGVARSGDAWVGVHRVQALDGTNYGDTNEITAPPIAVFTLDAATTARRLHLPDISIPPGLFKFFVRNSTGQALAASGNTLSYRTHSLKSV